MWLFQNALYKIAALVVACVLWAVTQGFSTDETMLDVPIRFTAVPAGLVIVDQSHDAINVRLEGSRAALRRAERGMDAYTVSLESAKAGEARYTIAREEGFDVPRGARILTREPPSISIQLEPRISKRVSVVPDVIGEPAPGFRVSSISVIPSQVLVEGARRSVRRIEDISTQSWDITGMKATTTQELPLSIGFGDVWRSAEDKVPVRVEVTIESVPAGRNQ